MEIEAWATYQHHRHSDSFGFIVALRDPGANENSVTLRPEHVNADTTYKVTKLDDYRAVPTTQVFGAALKEMVRTIHQTHSGVLVEYQRIDG